MALLHNTFGGKRPDITAAQLIGAAAAGVGPVLALAGAKLSDKQRAAADDLKVIALALIGADAVLRVGRNIKDGMVEAAGLATPSEPPLGPLTDDGLHEVPLLGMDPLEAPLEAAEIDAFDDDLTDDLDDEAQAIEREEILGGVDGGGD